MLELDQNRRHRDRSARSLAPLEPTRDGLEGQLLATLAAAAALMEVTSRIQRRTAEALRDVAAPGGDEDTGRQLGRVEDAIQQLSRVEQAIQALTPAAGRRWDGVERRRSQLWQAKAGSGPNRLVEPLTAREAVVLRLLCGTLPLGEIGRQLGVSRNTIKSQVGAVYRKLGVCGRDAAVERGRELGIL